MAVNLAGIDLNLLVVLEALLEEMHVTRAGERVGMSQPAVSNALVRLRGLFGDPLMVRVGRRMQLTERAHQLKEPLLETLDALRRTLDSPAAFDASAARFPIRLFASDYLTVVLAPLLRERLQTEAPGADLVICWGDRHRVLDMLRSGSVDFAVGHFALDASADFRRAEVFHEEPVVLGRRGHPAFAGPLTLDAFCAAPHLSVSYEGNAFGYVDQALARAGVNARSDIIVPHFGIAPFLLLDSDLLMVAGSRLGAAFAGSLPIEMRAPPFPIEPLRIEAMWHNGIERNPALCWARDLLLDVVGSL
jgi:DNA-binding transcriptional LysR family regulator